MWQHIVAMKGDRLTDAVTRAVRGVPCSVRALAEAANVPASTLVRIVAGERAATPAVAAAVARALDQWSARCGQLASSIRKAQQGEGK
jgi:plasmid maintenance system antidote protein VapI